MARLVDADKLMERFRIVAQSGGPVVVHVSDICAAIEDEAIEDAVEIVRCKDCKAWNRYEPTSVSGRCGYLCRMRMDDDFCSYGERRTDNDSN